MISVANRPIIGYVIDALVKNGIRDIIVVVGYRKEHVTRFLNDLDLPVQVVVQEKQIGTAHALQQAKTMITGDFLVLPGDNYIDPQSIARIQMHHNAMLVHEHPNPSNFGVVLVEGGYVARIIEKPDQAPSFIVSTGIYALNTDFFSFISNNTDMTDAVADMLTAGKRVRAVTAKNWQDAIYPWDLLRLNERLLRELPAERYGTMSRNTTIAGAVRIGKSTTVGPNTVITGPVVIGENCMIGPNCCILPNTSIGSRVTIEPFTSLGNAIVMDDTSIGSHSRIVDTVIGERCVLGDHTSTSTTEGILDIEGAATRAAFGAVIGDGVKSGAFTILRNCIIGNNATIEGNAQIVSQIIKDNALVI
jgi:glucose-1-phosphate thymidylyltransferase